MDKDIWRKIQESKSTGSRVRGKKRKWLEGTKIYLNRGGKKDGNASRLCQHFPVTSLYFIAYFFFSDAVIIAPTDW
jgi:hypothetical protein